MAGLTDWSSVAAALREQDIECVQDELLSRHTTFKIGGCAKLFCAPRTWQELKTVLSVCRECSARFYLLGKGSNMLFSDDGFDGAVVHIGEVLGGISVDGTRVTAQAGTPLAKVCVAAAQRRLAGLEFAYGIPGNVGGAVYMNAGAYGGEMKDVLESVTFLDETGHEQTLPVAQLNLAYRTSVFESKPWCILSAVFRLQEGEQSNIEALMQDYAARRADKQPLDMPSAGSTFKRPVGAFAGALIDQCGLRGFAIGGAAVSQKHCGFVVNTGNATCADVLALTDEVCRVVTEKTGFVLEKEIRVVK